MRVVARDYRTGNWVELELSGSLIERVSAVERISRGDAEDDWIAPAFCDIQVNGRWGHSFSSPDLTVEQVCAIVRAQAALGTARLCPTLITAPVRPHAARPADDCGGVRPRPRSRSDESGYPPRGAVPVGGTKDTAVRILLECMRDPDWELVRGVSRRVRAADRDRHAGAGTGRGDRVHSKGGRSQVHGGAGPHGGRRLRRCAKPTAPARG